jgi:hypothetical protein
MITMSLNRFQTKLREFSQPKETADVPFRFLISCEQSTCTGEYTASSDPLLGLFWLIRRIKSYTARSLERIYIITAFHINTLSDCPTRFYAEFLSTYHPKREMVTWTE